MWLWPLSCLSATALANGNLSPTCRPSAHDLTTVNVDLTCRHPRGRGEHRRNLRDVMRPRGKERPPLWPVQRETVGTEMSAERIFAVVPCADEEALILDAQRSVDEARAHCLRPANHGCRREAASLPLSPSGSPETSEQTRVGGGNARPTECCPPNGLEVNPRGQGPRGYGSAAHGLPACESRDAGRAPPFRF